MTISFDVYFPFSSTSSMKIPSVSSTGISPCLYTTLHPFQVQSVCPSITVSAGSVNLTFRMPSPAVTENIARFDGSMPTLASFCMYFLISSTVLYSSAQLICCLLSDNISLNCCYFSVLQSSCDIDCLCYCC